MGIDSGLTAGWRPEASNDAAGDMSAGPGQPAAAASSGMGGGGQINLTNVWDCYGAARDGEVQCQCGPRMSVTVWWWYG